MASRSYIIRDRGPVPAVSETDIETVTGLTRRIKTVLRTAIPPTWVRGEVSNLRTQASGHVYFSLKDGESAISCVMFRGDVVRSGSGGAMRDGAQLVVFGELDVYEPRGNYQLIVRVAVDDGRGRLQQQFEWLKQKLAGEGLFDPARKRRLPAAPATVALVTSPTGAAVHDFLRILIRRRWRGRVVVFPVKVQGEGAAAEMVAALALLAKLAAGSAGPRFDLVVIARGGGSLEDLWAFNEEPLVRAVAACPVPVVSAVGHEIDFTLCDFAADVRAETPSAAAELVSSGYLDVVERFRQIQEKLHAAADDHLHEFLRELDGIRSRLALVSPQARVERAHLRLDDLRNRLSAAARHRLQDHRREVATLAERLARSGPEPTLARVREQVRAVAARLRREIAVMLAARRQKLEHLADRVRAAGPDSVLRRGFVIIRDSARRPITARGQLQPGQTVTAQWHDGETPLQAPPGGKP